MEGQRSSVQVVPAGEDRFRVQLPRLDYRTVLRRARRGEVAMIIQRTPGWVLLQTKGHYPPGVFRLPTGSVHAREETEVAMRRELHEEANLVPGAFRRLCRLEYIVVGGRKDFYTEAYLIDAPSGQLRPNDAKEAIDAWREAPVAELANVARELRQLDPPWNGWGLFRSVLHEIVAGLLAPAS
jgi:8-oxo-dGTP pyrophosphatase MutT (NUDIX family)